jgi:hypothetical protein
MTRSPRQVVEGGQHVHADDVQVLLDPDVLVGLGHAAREMGAALFRFPRSLLAFALLLSVPSGSNRQLTYRRAIDNILVRRWKR